MADENIIALQERITYLERTVEDLNEVVTGLNEKVARLSKQVRDVRAHQEAVPDEPDMANDVPPHYGDPRNVQPGILPPKKDRG